MTQRGFTILEVLVGFVIAALLLSVILSAFAGGLRGLSRTDRISQAALVAQSRLAEVGHSVPLQAGYHEGRDASGYSWQVGIEPLRWELAGQLQERERVLYRVSARVLWDEGRGRTARYDLVTLRLGRIDEVQR